MDSPSEFTFITPSFLSLQTISHYTTVSVSEGRNLFINSTANPLLILPSPIDDQIMGQKLCCFRPQNQPPENPNPKETSSLPDEKFSGVESTIMTLEDYLILSPALNPIRGAEVSVLKRVYPSSPESDSGRYYTPTVSFSASGKLERIEEVDGEEGSRKPSMSGSRRPSLKKKVSFKLPEEAVIIFYSPEPAFDPVADARSPVRE